MHTLTFDTLKFVETLIAAGVPEAHAKAQLKAMSNAFSTNIQNLATEQDLKELESALEAKLDKVATNWNIRIDRVDAKLDKTEAELRGELILVKWMLGFLLAGVLTLIIKSFF